jgi:hypothetical protein
MLLSEDWGECRGDSGARPFRAYDATFFTDPSSISHLARRIAYRRDGRAVGQPLTPTASSTSSSVPTAPVTNEPNSA